MKKFLVYVFLSLSIFSSQLSAQWYQHSFDTMGTRAHVEFWLPDNTDNTDKTDNTANTRDAQNLIDKVISEMKRLDQALSPYIETSELSLLNREASTKKISVSDELFSLLASAAKISEMSGGAFDITYASIGYQYDYRKNIRPEQNAIDKALPAINYQSIKLDKTNRSVSFDNTAVKIDLGGIAKGYAIKQCIEVLRTSGIEHALMSAGGDTALLGDRMGRPWLVGIKHPRTDDKNAVHIPLSDEAISTSGDYERYFIEDNIRYHHIINPRTGDSARKVVSVSVIGRDATVVDALSTTLFVQGLKEGMALINKLDGYEAIIIDKEQRLHFSIGLQQ